VHPQDTKCTPQPEQESILGQFLQGGLDLEVYLDVLRATTKKRSSTFLVRKSAPPDKILATPMSLVLWMSDFYECTLISLRYEDNANFSSKHSVCHYMAFTGEKAHLNIIMSSVQYTKRYRLVFPSSMQFFLVTSSHTHTLWIIIVFVCSCSVGAVRSSAVRDGQHTERPFHRTRQADSMVNYRQPQYHRHHHHHHHQFYSFTRIPTQRRLRHLPPASLMSQIG